MTEERFRTPGAEWTTYRRADGEMIYGEYTFVTELEWFESDDEPTDLIEETWVLQSARKLTVNERPPDEDDE